MAIEYPSDILTSYNTRLYTNVIQYHMGSDVFVESQMIALKSQIV